MRLSTRYLGLPLDNPLMAGASPLADDLGAVKRLEDAGAAAVVMYSLFEEQILRELEGAASYIDRPAESFPEALTYFPRTEELKFRLGPDEYLEQIARIKRAVGIPVIGSLNGVTPGGWRDYAHRIEEAGADALELNVYFLPTNPDETGEEVENRTLHLLQGVKASVGIPVAVKLSPFFSSLPHFVRRLETAGADGVVIFNRFYQPDIDVEELEVAPQLRLSDSSELLLRLRWLAILSGRINLSLAVSGGVHTATDAIKALMAGAQGIQMVSALLRNGPEHLGRVKGEMAAWMQEHDYESVDQMRGSMGLLHCPDPSAVERANYLRVLHGGYA